MGNVCWLKEGTCNVRATVVLMELTKTVVKLNPQIFL